MRESGILFPVFSLPSRFGVGSFSQEAYDFVDFLHESAQGYWQILPIGPTGYGYSWWMKRFEKSFEIYDVIRIDHFHGFSEYYAIPYGDETAENGTKHKGPGHDFFKVVEEKIGPVRAARIRHS